MKNFWEKFGCLVIGWNFNILQFCSEASHKRLKKYTSAMLILIILWAFIGYSFVKRYVGAPWTVCVISAIIFVIIIIQIERQIILTVGKTGWLAAFRILIAIIMALIGSTILDQIIFKDDIGKKMIEIVDKQVTAQLPDRLTVIDAKLKELQIEMDSLERKISQLNGEIYRQPTIQSVSTATNPIPIRRPDGTDTVVYRTSVSRTPMPNPKIAEKESNEQRLEKLREEKSGFTDKKMNAESLLREELKSKQGFLEELNAIVNILKERPIALIFYLILFLFLMSLELFVVFSKVGDKKSDYDLIVEHQLEQKIRMLNGLKD